MHSVRPLRSESRQSPTMDDILNLEREKQNLIREQMLLKANRRPVTLMAARSVTETAILRVAQRSAQSQNVSCL
jgi:hypothetical protein